MSAPSLTLRSLQNEETGIDISVPRFQEEEAPLGGVSVLYEIAVLTRLDLFKTRLHRNEDVVQFSIYKAYREVEDLYNKLNKKYPKAGLPTVPKYSTIDKYSSEERVCALDRFMKAVSKNIELCHSSTFTQFIGINSQRLPSFSVPSSKLATADSNSESTNETPKTSEASGDLSEVFPKVKNAVSKAVSKSTTLETNNDKVDLFEEVKLVKETEKVCDIKKGSSSGLFDDFEDDSLFSSPVVAKPVTSPKQEKTVTDVKPKRKEPETKSEVHIDDSEIIIKDRKFGNISLFNEQDLGDYVTKDEEALFLVSPNDNERSKKNTLLFSSDTDSPVSDTGLHENLEDLLNLNPLPPSPVPKATKTTKASKPELESEVKNCDSTSEFQSKKPVPLPRKKSLGKGDSDEQAAMTPPEVMPRKVFLQKPEVPTKPVSTNQDASARSSKPPPISTKPALPKKPKPPPKPNMRRASKDIDSINANQPEKLENQTSVSSSIVDDLNKLDIMKYIEQEQKTLESEPSLFD